MIVLEAQTVRYRVTDTTILDGVDFTAAASNFTAIVGPNGAGKSTLLRILAGLQAPTAGTILIGGSPIAEIPLNEMARIRGYLSPIPEQTIEFTVSEVVAMGRHPWRSTSRETTAKVSHSLRLMDLEHRAGQAHSTLSTGEARRTDVARLLAQDARLLLLDEPVTGLDIGYADLVLAQLHRVASAGNTVVAVLHDLNAAAKYASHVVLLNRGAVVAAGSPDEVLTSDRLSDVYRHPIGVTEHPTREGLLVVSRSRDEA